MWLKKGLRPVLLGDAVVWWRVSFAGRSGHAGLVHHSDNNGILYTIEGTNMGRGLYPDDLEIDYPGDLPNAITIRRMLVGLRYHRDQMVVG